MEILNTKTNAAQAASAGMPSVKKVQLTLGESKSEYTAPADGYFKCTISVGLGAFNMYNIDTGVGYMWYNGKESYPCKACVPARAGQRLFLEYAKPTIGEYKELYFTYAEGSK